MKTEVKRDKVASDHGVKPNNDEPVLYRLFATFAAKGKKPAPPKKEEKMEKLSQMPVQMKEDESEGEVSTALCRSRKKS
jgi:hypothetical protein